MIWKQPLMTWDFFEFQLITLGHLPKTCNNKSKSGEQLSLS